MICVLPSSTLFFFFFTYFNYTFFRSFKENEVKSKTRRILLHSPLFPCSILLSPFTHIVHFLSTSSFFLLVFFIFSFFILFFFFLIIVLVNVDRYPCLSLFFSSEL